MDTDTLLQLLYFLVTVPDRFDSAAIKLIVSFKSRYIFIQNLFNYNTGKLEVMTRSFLFLSFGVLLYSILQGKLLSANSRQFLLPVGSRILYLMI